MASLTSTSADQRVKILERIWLQGAQCDEALSIEVCSFAFLPQCFRR